MSAGISDAFRRISHSLAEMALITGLLARVLHVVATAYDGAPDWRSFVGTVVVVPVVVAAMATIHLANYPVRQWLWRAPVFALGEVVAEAGASLALIATGRERWGAGRAEIAEWPIIASRILVWRFGMLCFFALVLGVVVQWVRRRELTAERRHHHPPTPTSPQPPETPDRRKPPESPNV